MTTLLTILTLVVSALQPAAQPPAQPLTRREFVIRDFKTESGVVLPEARIVYTTLGTLNAAGDNAILLPSHYMANINGYNWLIGAQDRVFNPARDYLVLTELFGNGRSSSPSNTPEPFHGPRFPVMTIRDNVDAVHRLLTQELHVSHLRAVVGFSMGAEQAFQWAVSHPTFMDAIVATSGTAKCYGHGYVRLEGQIAALTTDPAWQGGEYTAPPAKGLEAFGMVWAGWLYSQEWWRQELWKTNTPPGTTFEQAWQAFRRRFGADANDYILQARTWQRHDVGATPGFSGDVERALRSIKARVLYMPSETDLYFPLTDARYEQAFIPGVTFTPIPSLWGHTAGAASNPADLKFLNERIAAFLARPPARAAFDPHDLEGTWTYATMTPLERPQEFSGKERLTEEEAAAYEGRTNARQAATNNTAGPDWWDPGTRTLVDRRTSLIVDPRSGRLPPMTGEAQARAAARAQARRERGPATSVEDLALNERCLLWATAGPPMLPGVYNNNVEIVQTRDSVVLFNEMIHDARIIPTVPRPPSPVPRWQGDSRGHWDGNTFVVDTVHFSDKTTVRGSDEHLHLVERFTRVDADTIDYRFVVDDPTVWSRPWSAEFPLRKTSDRIFEYACHEGNFRSIQGILWR